MRTVYYSNGCRNAHLAVMRTVYTWILGDQHTLAGKHADSHPWKWGRLLKWFYNSPPLEVAHHLSHIGENLTKTNRKGAVVATMVITQKQNKRLNCATCCLDIGRIQSLLRLAVCVLEAGRWSVALCWMFVDGHQNRIGPPICFDPHCDHWRKRSITNLFQKWSRIIGLAN